jgi:hypothetical protein
MAYHQIVDAYIRDHRRAARAEAEKFRRLPSLKEAIRHAALCHCLTNSTPPKFKKHPHQYRIPRDTLAKAERQLQAKHDEIQKAADFETLHEVVAATIGDMPKIGDLTVYDIAHRIGARLRKEPQLVYLHRGTLEGARRLGLAGHKLRRDQLPRAFSRLNAAEIEDCLCIYKNALVGRLFAPESCTSQVVVIPHDKIACGSVADCVKTRVLPETGLAQREFLRLAGF